MSARQSTGNTMSKRTTTNHAKKSDRRDSEEEPAFVPGHAPRRWAPAGTGEWEGGSDSDDGPELLHRRHPFSQYADARNLSGISGIGAMHAIIDLTARKPSRRTLVNTYGLIQTENFVLVPMPITAPAQQSTPGLGQDLEGPRKPRGYNTSPTGGCMQPAHLEMSQVLDQQRGDTKMPVVTAERAAEASLLAHFINATNSLAPQAAPPMMPRSPPHPTLGHAYRPSAPYPSDSPSAFHGLYNNSSSKKRSRASLSGEAMSNSQSASIDKDLCGAPSHPVTAAGEPSRASASTAKRSRSTNQSEEDLHRDQESFKVRIRKYVDQYGVPQLMMFQKGDPEPMDISSPEDEEGAFTIGKKGAKTTRKDKGGKRKGHYARRAIESYVYEERTILSVEPVLAMSNESESDPRPTPAIAEPLGGSAEIGAQGMGVADSLTQASACPAQPSGKASKGQAVSSNSTSQDAQASIKGESASTDATTSPPPVVPSSASPPSGPALPPPPVNEQDQDEAETKRVKRSLFKKGETASPGNASPSSGPSSGGLDLLLYAAFEHHSSTGAGAAKPNTEAHGKAPQGKAPVHRCITQATKPAEGLKCDEQVVFATDGHAKDDVAPTKLPRQPSDQHAHADMLLLLAHTSPSSGPSSAGVLPPPLEADGPAGTQHRGPSSGPSSSSTSSPATQQMPSPPAPPAASPAEDLEPLPESDAPVAASTSHKKKARWEWAGHYAAKRGRKRINRWPQAYQAYQFWAAQAMAANYGYYPYHHYYPQGGYGQPGYMPPPPPEGGYAYGQPYYPHPEAYHGHMPPGYEEEEDEEAEGEGKRKREGDGDEDGDEGGEEQEDGSEEGHDAQMGKTPAGVTYHSAPQGGDFYDESEMDDMMRAMDEEDAARVAAAKRAAKGAAKSAAKSAAKGKGGKKKKKVRREE